MPEETRPTAAEQRRRSAAALFLRVHDLDAADALERAQAPVARLVELIIVECLKSGFEELRVLTPKSDRATVQYCRAGACLDVLSMPSQRQPELINRLKVMANLDIAKHPTQRGTIKVRLAGQVLELEIEVRLREHAEEASLRMPAAPVDLSLTDPNAAT